MWLRMALGGLLAVAPCAARELRLVKTLPVSELKNEQGIAPKIGEADVSFQIDPKGNLIRNDFGFVRMGSSLMFYTGFNGMVMDLESGVLKQALPANLAWAKVSYSGERVVGLLNRDKIFWDMHNGQARERKAGTWTWWLMFGWIHPADQVLFVPDDATRHPYPPYNMKGVLVLDLDTEKVLKRVPIDTTPIQRSEPSRDGKLVFGGLDPFLPSKAQDTQTGSWLNLELPDSSGSTYVFNRDASLVAGTKLEYDGFTFVWDRLNKHYKWKSTDSAMPSAFSNNGAYLLCEEVVVDASNGKVVFGGLKGERGKFSPDGRSLVTVDKLAFYVYTLPKESEPIFGVFQKPEPWSPGKVPARKPKGKAKTK